MSTPKGPPVKSGLAQGGYTTNWRLTVESETLEPQTYGELVQLYGDQLRLWDFLMWAKRTTNVQSRNVQVLEEGFIHDTLDVQTEVAITAAGVDVTLISNKSFGRVGFDVHIPAQYTPFKVPISYKIINKTGTGPYTYTLTPYDPSWEVSVAIPVGQNLIVGASSFAPGEGQPPGVTRAWYEHFHQPRIMKETLDIEGGQQALKEWNELSQARDGSTLMSRSLNETEFRLRIQMNDYLLMGQPNNNALTGQNKFGDDNAVNSDYGLIHGMYNQAMRQYYTGGAYTKDNFDIIKFLLASQGVGKGVVNYCYGQELGLGIENSGLQFINEFSGGTDLYKDMSSVGFVMKKFTKNGIISILCEIPEFSNPVAYGASGYNFETMGMIFPDAKVTADMNYLDSVGRASAGYERKALNHVTLGYLVGNGENRKLVIGDAAGVNGLGLKFTNDWDNSTWYMLTEQMNFLLALNQTILVLRSDD